MQPKTFKCMKCGECCSWRGYVHLTREDITRLSDFIEITEGEFINAFTRITEDRQGLSLNERENGECVFLSGSICSVYKARPKQCRNFPTIWSIEGAEALCKGLKKEIPDTNSTT
ncbi:MAG: YkgJ family cysteine cluster protein [Candidatus Aureabacteria bacterium]|nr:YkgJ family cysteine cluster protein [Candidatus Auribacterota bacterium]MCK5160134.1 YkgJ family cysteine cluster protein [Candidatus Auribacterota bacterium]